MGRMMAMGRMTMGRMALKLMRLNNSVRQCCIDLGANVAARRPSFGNQLEHGHVGRGGFDVNAQAHVTVVLRQRMQHRVVARKLHERIQFATLFERQQSLRHVVVTFLALLELVKLSEIRLRQKQLFC